MKNTSSQTIQRSRGAAFTLIELLVVIAIIAILAAILFPVFARARENARRSSCQSNLKQVGLGILQYAQDYDEYLPIGNLPSGNAFVGQGWASTVMPYIKSTQVLKCPSDPGPQGSVLIGNRVPVSYAYSQALVRDSSNSNLILPTSLAAFNEVSRTVTVFEVTKSFMDAVDSQETDSPTGTGRLLGGGNKGSLAGGMRYATGLMDNGVQSGNSLSMYYSAGEPITTQHFDGSNFLAADGHVKFFRPTSISCGSNRTTATGGASGGQAEGTAYSGADKHAMTFSFN